MTRFNIRSLLITVSVLAPCMALAQNWVPDTVGLSTAVSSIAINTKGDIFVGTEAAGNGGVISPEGVYLSTNLGGSWTSMKSSSEAKLGPVYGIDSKGDVFVQGYPGEYESTNDGNLWSEFRINPSSGSDPEIDPDNEDFAIGTAGYMFMASNGGPLWVSSDYGSMWCGCQGVDLNNQFTYPTFVAYNPTGYYFAGTSTAIYKSDGATGFTWGSGALSGAPALGNYVHFAFSSSGYGVSGMIVAGGPGGLFLSQNDGSSWLNITPPSANSNTIFALAIGSNGNIFAGMSSGGISVSADTGQTWTDISVAPGLPVNALAIYDGALYAGTNSGVFQYQFESDGVATTSAAPSSLTLTQNTPNPVSSSTNIQFSVPDAGQVSLRVFDVTGREVATVASGFYAPGTYDVSLDAHSFTDGAYYYRIESGGQTASRMFVIEH